MNISRTADSALTVRMPNDGGTVDDHIVVRLGAQKLFHRRAQDQFAVSRHAASSTSVAARSMFEGTTHRLPATIRRACDHRLLAAEDLIDRRHVAVRLDAQVQAMRDPADRDRSDTRVGRPWPDRRPGSRWWSSFRRHPSDSSRRWSAWNPFLGGGPSGRREAAKYIGAPSNAGRRNCNRLGPVACVSAATPWEVRGVSIFRLGGSIAGRPPERSGVVTTVRNGLLPVPSMLPQLARAGLIRRRGPKIRPTQCAGDSCGHNCVLQFF